MTSSHLRQWSSVSGPAQRRLHRLAVSIVAIVSTLIVAACGTSGGGTQTQDSGGARVQAAEANFRALLKGAQGLGGLNEPLKSKPKPGKLLVQLNGTPSVTAGIYHRAFAEATAAAGWRLKTIPFKLADPSTLVAGLDTALQFHPAAVTVSGVDPKLWAASRDKYKAAGIPIIGITVPTLEPRTNPPVLNVTGKKGLQAHGRAAADWFISDSKGKGSALVLAIPAYPLFKIMSDAFKAEVAKNCPGCKVKTLDLTIQSVAAQAIPGETVSALRQDPSITHIAAMDGSFLNGLSTQLKAAGLTQVRLGGSFLRPDNVEEVKSGTISAITQDSTAAQAWYAVDAALRISEGMSLPTDGYAAPPFSFVDKSNVGSLRDPYNSPQNYRDLFKKLWLVG